MAGIFMFGQLCVHVHVYACVYYAVCLKNSKKLF